MSYKGMFFKRTKPTSIKEGVWWEETCVRRQGGYDFDGSNLPSGTKWIPKGAVLKLTDEGKCAVVKTATVVETAAAGAKAIKVAVGSLLAVGDTVSGNKITAIKTGDEYDTLTVDATAAEIALGTVLTDYDKDKDTLLGLSYDTFEYEDGVYGNATPTLQVYEVEENTLPYPLNDDIKAGLNATGVIRFKIQ